MATLRITVQLGGSSPFPDDTANRRRMLVYTGVVPTGGTTDIAGNIGARTSRDQYAYDLNRPRVPGAISVTAHQPQLFSSDDLTGRNTLVRDLADHIDLGAIEVLDFGTALAGQTGGGAIMAAVSGGSIVVTGLTGMTADSVGNRLDISGAVDPLNNGSFDIIAFNGATSVTIAAGSAPGGEGTLTWSETGVVADRAALEAYL